MLGSTATANARATLPILAEHKIPAVGFYTGAALTGPGDVFNFRASYAQEITSTVESVLAAEVNPQEICAYVRTIPMAIPVFRALSTRCQSNRIRQI